MKGSWVTTFAVGGVILLLTLFLGFQYNWLAQVSAAESERMHRRVDADTKNFADDLNREIQAAYFNFQTDSESWEKSDWTAFNERYDYWKTKTDYPELINEFVFFRKGDAKALKYDLARRAFVESAELSTRATAIQASLGGDDIRQFYADEFALVMPIHKAEQTFERVMLLRKVEGDGPKMHMPERFGSLVIFLNKDFLTGSVFPALTAKHFPEGNYNVSVSDRDQRQVYQSGGKVTSTDATSPLISLSPDKMVFFGDRAVFSRLSTEKSEGIIINERIESKTYSHTQTGPNGTKTGTLKIEVQPGPQGQGSGVKRRTSVIATSDGTEPWVLNVQHVAGSIDAFTRNEFRKSFAVGLGLYLLLVGAIVAIVLSALRSKRFAQRQIDFVSSVSHEFRTPLAVIYSASENLADGVTKDSEQVSRYGDLIKGEGRKLSAMVEQILQFAGARSGKKKYSFSPVNVASVIDSAIEECRPILEEKGFELEASIDRNIPPVNVDAEALSIALQNLISNAVKYSNGSKWVGVAAANDNGKIELSVEDRGIGIASHDLKQIFEPFYRSKEVVDAQIHGNGLGLALVKEIAEAHGGKVRAKSEAGKGSEFTIELPNSKL